VTDCDPCHIVDRGAVADKSHAMEICSFPQACNVLLSQADLFLWASLADSVWRLEHVPPQLNRGDSRKAKDRRVYRR